ncbi:MAG TPA: hypothetical protein VHE58_04600 [Burkholderiales bacterium]|nr:hypothetical protein [Burkholderiales bacterium]
MFKTLIAKPTVITASALLFASLVGVHNAKAEQGGFGYVDSQEQARHLLQHGGVVESGYSQAPAAAGIVRSVKLDAQEQARRLIAGPIAGSNDGPVYIGAMLTLKPQEVDAHKQIERVLSAPLP